MSHLFDVTSLNKYVNQVLEQDHLLKNFKVAGELSGFKRYPSGHLYFSLKDKSSQVSCVMFKGYTGQLNFLPSDGLSVVITAKANLYDRDGRFQLLVTDMQPEGVGSLYLAYEKLKKQLQAEGLFDSGKKKPIPFLPRRIGVITSPKGAVIEDIQHVLARRFPNYNLLIYPTLVQGKEAAAQIVSGLQWFNQARNVDVIIVARGGGSVEDLWCFNSEILVREVYASTLPVISAVGHETDFTLIDFVSDLRAPTPSAAAELVMPLKGELENQIQNHQTRLKSSLQQLLKIQHQKLTHLKTSPALKYPLQRVLEKNSQWLDQLSHNMKKSIHRSIENHHFSIQKQKLSLQALNPLRVLNRGYSIVWNPELDKPVSSIDQVEPNQELTVRLADGEFYVKTLEPKEKNNGNK